MGSHLRENVPINWGYYINMQLRAQSVPLFFALIRGSCPGEDFPIHEYTNRIWYEKVYVSMRHKIYDMSF